MYISRLNALGWGFVPPFQTSPLDVVNVLTQERMRYIYPHPRQSSTAELRLRQYLFGINMLDSIFIHLKHDLFLSGRKSVKPSP